MCAHLCIYRPIFIFASPFFAQMTRSRKFEGRRRAIPSRELRIKKGGKVWVAVPLESVQRGQQLARLESPKGYSFVNYPTKTAGSSHAPCRYQPPSPWEARIELQDFSVRLFFLSNVPLLLLTILEKSCAFIPRICAASSSLSRDKRGSSVD